MSAIRMGGEFAWKHRPDEVLRAAGLRSDLNLITTPPQRPHDFLDMRGAAGFQFDFDPAQIDRQAAAAEVMVEVEDIGFEAGDDGEEGSQSSRDIIEADRKAEDAPLPEQLLANDPLRERAVHIAAADHQDHPAAGRISTLCPGPCRFSDDAGPTIHQNPKILVLSLLAQSKCTTLEPR